MWNEHESSLANSRNIKDNLVRFTAHMLPPCSERKDAKSKRKKTKSMTSIYEGSLFFLFYFVLFVLIRSSNPGSWSLWKALKEEGCIG